MRDETMEMKVRKELLNFENSCYDCVLGGVKLALQLRFSDFLIHHIFLFLPLKFKNFYRFCYLKKSFKCGAKFYHAEIILAWQFLLRKAAYFP